MTATSTTRESASAFSGAASNSASNSASRANLEFTFEQLMTEQNYQEPLIAADVRCHGGYIDGAYVPPRSKVRGPAVASWRDRLRREALPLVHVPAAYVPPNYPNYPQAKFLMQEGIHEPVTRALTLIAIIEGFGARIRDLPVPDFKSEIREDITGTALAHLGGGLFEAHARDEAGHRDQGGHKQMWEAARDIGLDKPKIPGDVLMRLMSGGGPRGEVHRLYPQLSAHMEGMITSMAAVLVVETFAEDTFDWAMKLLGDPEVAVNAERARHLVSCIAADEIPHVDYLTVALSELRGRTLQSADGAYQVQGAEVVDSIFARQLRGMATRRPAEQRERMRNDIHSTIADAARATRIASRFESLDSGWQFPHADDEAMAVLLRDA